MGLVRGALQLQCSTGAMASVTNRSTCILTAYSESGCYKSAGQYVSIMRSIRCMVGLV